MGWGGLLKGLLGAVPVVGPALGAIGSIAGAAGGAAAGGRRDDNEQRMRQNQLAAQLYGTQQGAQSRALESQSAEGLQRSQLGITSDRERARQSILGSLMKNLQSSQVSSANPRMAGKVPTFSGGLQASSVLDPLTRQHGAGLIQKALTAQQTGSDVPGATNFQGGVLTPPVLAKLKQSGLLEKILGGVGLGGSLMGGLVGNLPKRKPTGSSGYDAGGY